MEGQLNWKSDKYALRHPHTKIWSDRWKLNMSAPGAHNLQSQTTLQVRVESSRETTYVLYLENIPRDSSYVSTSTSRIVVRVQLYLENRRTSPALPRESSYVSSSTSRIVVRVYLENNREGRPERGIESHQKLLSHRKARRSDHKVTTLQCCQHCLGKSSRATERPEIVVIKWQHCSAANTVRTPVLSQIVQ